MVSVNYVEQHESALQGYYTCGNITVYDDMSITSSRSHLAEIVLAVEVINVIKDNKNG